MVLPRLGTEGIAVATVCEVLTAALLAWKALFTEGSRHSCERVCLPLALIEKPIVLTP